MKVELFGLRTLLNYVTGSTSFEDIRTVDGILQESFNKACIALGLLENDEMWINCMNEAVDELTAKKCRQLFVVLILHCGVSDKENFFDRYLNDLKEDFVYKFHERGYGQNSCEEYAKNELICDLSDQVTTAGGSWHSQQLGHPDFGLRQRLRNENEENEENNENLELQAAEHFFTENYPKLTDEQ